MAISERVMFSSGWIPISRLLGVLRRALAEDRMRHRAELDEDLGGALEQALAGAQVERHALPAPIVDMGLDRDEGLGVAVAAQLVVIARHRRALDRARAVLAGHDLARATTGRSARSTLTFSSRTAVASKLEGGSIATSASNWSMWFWTMSRKAPAPS